MNTKTVESRFESLPTVAKASAYYHRTHPHNLAEHVSVTLYPTKDCAAVGLAAAMETAGFEDVQIKTNRTLRIRGILYVNPRQAD